MVKFVWKLKTVIKNITSYNRDNFRMKMDKTKLIFNWIFPSKSTLTRTDPEEPKYDHVISVEELEGRMEVTKSASKKTDKKKSRKIAVIVDFLFCGLVTLLWVTAFSFFVRFSLNSQQEKVNAHEYFYFSYFIIVVIVSVTGIYFESLILKGFEKFSPKIAVVVKKGQCKNGPYVLKLRVADVPDKEFLETELEESNLTYDDVLNVCCKELKLEKDNIVRLRKIPDTKIRNDDDIKRFRRLEYLEVITKE